MFLFLFARFAVVIFPVTRRSEDGRKLDSNLS